ncbi:hypothetical protein GS399_01550 [Pedobacter sp. HMF7647]|uniref:Uncharacterized protein n=1 Tax=Hufsiella arboris TaxID=2695275 RepID=A0A7K1Y5J1_9SPHI|nr:hypothetical protein [Hufsiella arboris]MXV49641.1 hypothetical protein [Hufsiella arboris]
MIPENNSSSPDEETPQNSSKNPLNDPASGRVENKNSAEYDELERAYDAAVPSFELDTESTRSADGDDASEQ